MAEPGIEMTDFMPKCNIFQLYQAASEKRKQLTHIKNKILKMQ